MPAKAMDHAAYQAKVRKMDAAALRFSIADARETVDTWRRSSGEDHPNAGYYLDEIAYCAAELARRERGAK